MKIYNIMNSNICQVLKNRLESTRNKIIEEDKQRSNNKLQTLELLLFTLYFDFWTKKQKTKRLSILYRYSFACKLTICIDIEFLDARN
jgi:hypothetical protein